MNNSNNYLHYKDYTAVIEFSEEDSIFYGKAIGIKSLISFEGSSVSTLIEDFHNSVDEYLDYCSK